MRRPILVALIVACLLACGASVWALRVTMIWPFLLPGATDVVVTSQGLDSFTIMYHIDKRSESWRDDMAHRLAVDDWRGREYSFGFTQRFIVTMVQPHDRAGAAGDSRERDCWRRPRRPRSGCDLDPS